MVWYAVMTAPQSEQKVRKQAEERGIPAYVPMMRTFLPRDARQEVLKPLMPGYAFVDLSPDAPRFDIFAPDKVDMDRPSELPDNVFSGYVADQARPSLSPIRGCLGFVLWDGAPLALRGPRTNPKGEFIQGDIEDLRIREMGGEFDLTGRTANGRYVIPKFITIGRLIRFVAGPLLGFSGYICNIISDKVVGIDLGVLGEINTPIEYIASER